MREFGTGFESLSAGNRCSPVVVKAQSCAFARIRSFRMIAERIQTLSLRFGLPRARRSRQTARDVSLARRLYNTFERDLELAEIQGIHFYVQNGIVTLYGTVRHALDRDLLMTLVREMQGVKGIVTHLQLVDSRFQDTGDTDSEHELTSG